MPKQPETTTGKAVALAESLNMAMDDADTLARDESMMASRKLLPKALEARGMIADALRIVGTLTTATVTDFDAQTGLGFSGEPGEPGEPEE